MTTGEEREQEASQGQPSEGEARRRGQRRRGQQPSGEAQEGARAAQQQRGAGQGAEEPRRRGGRRAQEAAQKAAEEAPAGPEVPAMPRMLARYREEVVPALMREFGYKSIMEVPRVSKIVLNIGMGEALQNARALESATRDLSMVTGQKPVTTRARKSISAFKIREGMPIGLMVTLRGRRMYEFLDRLISSALPRIRDFQGVPRDSFDGRGNYSLGIREQVIFPEIDYNSIDRIRGLQVVITTTARNDAEGLRLLELLGMPFARPAAARVGARVA